jgi:hypothetical protein
MTTVSAIIINATAAEFPTKSEVDITAASIDDPVTYITEDGIRVTIYDPNISIAFSEVDHNIELTHTSVVSNSTYINAPDLYGNGTKTESFTVEANKIITFGLPIWEGGPTYNVALYTEDGTRKAVAVGVSKSLEAVLYGISSTGNYYFRVSTYDTAGNGRYYTYML